MNSEAGPKKRAYFIFAIAALGLLMGSIDSTIVAVGVPTLLTDLRTNLALVGWVLTGYLFAQGIIMPIVGKLSDDLGRKRVFLASIVVFTASSLAAGLAPNILWLIVFRVFQGIGGGAFLPSATGFVSDAFGERRATAIGLFSSIVPIGGILGPNLGGFIIDNFSSWRWIFFVNIPIGVALLVIGLIILPASSPKSNTSLRQLDMVGIGLYVGAVLAVLYAITNWAMNTEGAAIETWGLLAAGLVLFFLFMWHEDRVEQPIIDTKLLRWRPFLAVNIYNFILGALVFGLASFVPYYTTIAYGMTAGQNGLLLTPRSLGMMAMSAIASVFIIRFRYRLPMIAGMLFIALALFLLSRGYHNPVVFGIGLSNIVLLGLLVTLWGMGMGISNPASFNAGLDLMPEKVAAITGTRGMFRLVGGVFGIAVITLILSYYPDKAFGMQRIYLGYVFLLLLLIPIVFLIPDSASERRIRAQE